VKIYLVVDPWQYDGALDIIAAYSNPQDASNRMFKERMDLAEANDSYRKRFQVSTDIHTLNRILSITTKELEVL
jgi:hypothetical protein